MRVLRAFFARLAGLFHAGRRERELQEEFESHLQMHIEDNLRAGMSPEEARRRALLKFGGMEAAREQVRNESRALWLETWWKDLGYAVRGMRMNPGFASTAILSLALGIGTSVAIFTVADNLLLRPLPYPDAGRLVMLWETNPHTVNGHNVVSPANYFDWKAQSSSFTAIAGFLDLHVIFGDGKRSEELDAQAVTGELLPLLQVQPVLGHLITPEEDAAGAHLALISYRLWQSWFGGDPSVIGRQVQVNARPFTVIGVLPPGFYFNSRSIDVWLTLGLKPAANLRKTQGRWMLTLARMKPEVSLRQARAEMSGIARRLELAYPGFDKGWGVNVEPLRDSLVRQVKTSLLVLLGAVALLLAVACANVANLLLARYNVRRREMAVRGALGAARMRLLRQLLTESLALGTIGGVLGILLARVSVHALVAMAPRELTHSLQVSFDTRIVAFAFLLSLFTSVIFGLAPALVACRSDLNLALHDGSRASTGGGGRLRSWLVMAEIGCSVALLAGAGLLFRTLISLESVNPGLDPAGLLTFRVSVPSVRYSDPARRVAFFKQAVERMAQLPGVRSASAVSYLPFNGLAAATRLEIAGRPPAKPGEELVAVIRTVLPGYFRTVGIPFIRGRDFTFADDDPSAPQRFIVNQAFVRRYLPEEDPLETRISARMGRENPFGEIIGVVGDVKEGSLDQGPVPTVYYVHSHLAYGQMVFVLRAGNSPLSLAGPARNVIHGLDPELPLAGLKTMDSVLRETYARQKLNAVLLLAFSLAALLLAAIGIYGVLAYSVTQRIREIGVRIALGAQPEGIARMVLARGAKLVAAGTLLGMGAALVFSGLMKSLLYGVGPHDPLTFIAAPGVLAAVALAASYIPARRAARVSPMEALRTE